MALVQCPDCGKMVSDKAKACPNCGCPSSFFAVSEEKTQIHKTEEKGTKIQDQKRVVFRFGGQEFSYLKKDSDCIKALGCYLVMAELVKYIADTAYDRLGGIGAVLREFPSIMDTFLQDYVFEATVGLLYHMGDNISIEQFVRKYGSRYTMQYEPYYSGIVEKYAEIRHDEAKLAEYRSAVKASRGRWTGGGFGLKGAVKGAVTAGMLNLGSDFLHSFGDAADERKDSQEIQKRLQALYKEPQTKRKLSGGMRTCVLNIMGAIRDELVEIGALSPEVKVDYNKAVTLYNNTLKWEGDSETLYKNMAQCIRYYPVDADFYRKLEPAIMESEEKDVSRFIEFWGFHSILSQLTSKSGDEADLDDWDLKRSLDMYYEKYKKYQLSDELSEEKRRALTYKTSRERDAVELADNVRRRFGGLTKNIEETNAVINAFLYMIRPEFRPAPLKKSREIDQYIFCDNGEVVVTDYAILIFSEPVKLDEINEIWYGADGEGGFLLRIMLKNHRKYIEKRVKKKSSIDIATLLNIALEPYRETTYVTTFGSELLDKYIILRNSEEILALDNREDKRKKKLIEDEQKKQKGEEARRYSAEKRKDCDVELADAVRRRFQKLLDIGIADDDFVVNKYIYEMESESIAVSPIARRGECKSDEFMFYADEVCVITDYTVCVIGADRRQSNFALNSINEIYYSDYQELTVTLKGADKNKSQEKTDRVKINIDTNKKHKGTIFFFLSIVLEPYRDIDYIPEIQDIYSMYRPDDFLRKFEEKESFSDFIDNILDDEKDKEKKRFIKSRAEERMKIRKDEAESYRQKNIKPEVDKFAAAFTVLYPFLYEKCEQAKDSGKDIKYFTRYRNHFDYEVYENLPFGMKKMLDEIPEKGVRILGGEGRVLLMDRYVNMGGRVFALYDLKEILEGDTVRVDESLEDDSLDDWIDDDKRYIIEYQNGSIEVVKFKTTLWNWDLWFSLNYVLKIMQRCCSDNHFLQDKGYFCEQCNSFQVVQEEGFLGKKYRCTNCNNKSKKSIIVYEKAEKAEIDAQEVSAFVLFNKLDTENAANKKMFCVYCGKKIARETKFCNFCGKPVPSN